MPLKDFSCLSGAKLTGQKFYPWRHDNWPIGQWVIFHAASDTAYVNQFFPAWIYNVIQIRSGETSRPLDSVARSIAARPHALKLASLTFRTYERSTCCKSRKRCILRYASCLEDASSTVLSLCYKPLSNKRSLSNRHPPPPPPHIWHVLENTWN